MLISVLLCCWSIIF